MREPKDAMMCRVECLVIGGGLAGAMAAMRLAQAKREVLLIEKERAAQHKVCGEFLSPEAVAYLREAHVEPLRLGAVRLRRVRLAAGERVVEAVLPFEALSLSRKMLDEALLTKAEEAGCLTRRGAAVERLVQDEDGWRVELADGALVRAAKVFLATGKHDLRGWNRRRDPGAAQSDFVGFKLHWKLTPAAAEKLCDTMELFLFRGGYGGISLIEDGAANLCLVVRKAALHASGGWTGLMQEICTGNNLLRERLDGAESKWERPLSVGWIPYGHLAREADGMWRLGDQAAVIPSFTGDGMAIALHSGALAAEMYLAGASEVEYQRKLAGQLRRGMKLASAVAAAMVSPIGQRVVSRVLPALPQAMRWIAAGTRIPHRALPTAQREFA
ncbi:NAD(P)/FAD-dependent oxidoreductase [Terracidiphilus sp.]|uniref:NAD(P)/FAD-dependent oxidoreductase n=1 Tax=Terracidiphilus sp. TaxID=1964191 RepID=UPI003C16AB7A